MHYLDAVELVYLESWIFEEDLNIIYLLVSNKNFEKKIQNRCFRAQNLLQGIVIKTSYGTWVSRLGLGSFVDINIFVIK